MRVRLIPRRLLASVIVLPLLLLLALPAAALAQSSQGFYQQTNLVSDLTGLAQFTDSNLVNSWGLVHGPTTPGGSRTMEQVCPHYTLARA